MVCEVDVSGNCDDSDALRFSKSQQPITFQMTDLLIDSHYAFIFLIFEASKRAVNLCAHSKRTTPLNLTPLHCALS